MVRKRQTPPVTPTSETNSVDDRRALAHFSLALLHRELGRSPVQAVSLTRDDFISYESEPDTTMLLFAMEEDGTTITLQRVRVDRVI